MTVEYVELTGSEYVSECVDLHKKIFNLTDADAFPPAFFHLLLRDDHPLGFVVGCYRYDNQIKTMIGIAVAMADFPNNSVYCLLIGMLPEYQHKKYGYDLFIQLCEIAKSKDIIKLYGIFDPLESNLGKLFINVGGKATKYIEEPYQLTYSKNLPDKVLYERDLIKYNFINNNKYNDLNLNSTIPVVKDLDCEQSCILIQIPENFIKLQNTDQQKANEWRLISKKLLSFYMNNKEYHIIKTLTKKEEKKQKIYYVLQKNIINKNN